MQTNTTTRLARLSKSEAAEQGLEWYYNEQRGTHVVRFFENYLCHSKGRFAGKAFTLLPWQRELLEELFGWVRIDNEARRYRLAYISTAKKSGKSTLLAGIGLYLLTADNERGAEIFSAAADRDQASIVYREAANMVAASPLLQRQLEVIDSRRTITFRKTSSFWRVLSGDSFRAEGLNIHGLLFDELHSQRDRRLWDSLRFGGAARFQPLLCSISTAGYDRASICYEQYSYAKNVLRDWRYDPQFFAQIHEVEESDDWTSPDNWPKANPSWGVTIDPQDFAADFKESTLSTTKENAFKRYRLNCWTSQDTAWLKMEAWQSCAVPPPGPLEGRECWCGLDLATTFDTSAFVALFPALNADGEHDGTFDVLCRFWIPGDNALERERRDGIPYTKWAEDPTTGLTFTDGNVTDYDVVRRDINEFAKRYNVRKICIDRWNATQLALNLQGDGLEVVGFSQGIGSMSPPSKTLENLVCSGKLRHDGNLLLTYMASVVSIKTDANGNIRPIKPKPGSPHRIDGIVSLIMAIGGFSTQQKPDAAPEPRIMLL
jgi:phage terminase large subunit-like protein